MRRLLEIHAPGAEGERHELKGSRVSVGAGSDCAVRLSPATGLPARAFDLVFQGEGVLVEVADTCPRGVVYEGQEQRRVLVPWGDELFFGPARFTFLEDQTQGSRTGALLAGLALLLAGVAAAGAAAGLRPEAASAQELEAPALVEGVAACPDGKTARHRAELADAAARAKEERFPYSRRDGIQALRLYREARACFTTAGDQEAAARLESDALRWSERMNDEYSAVRLRQRLALDKARHRDALEATKALEHLVAEASGPAAEPYRAWLGAVRRELERRVSRNKK